MCFDWSPLGIAEDPFPMSASAIEAAAQEWGRVGVELGEVATEIERVTRLDAASQAVDAIRASVLDTVGYLGKAQERYAVASAALTEYAYALANVQRVADQALAEATSALRRFDEANEVVAHLEGRWTPEPFGIWLLNDRPRLGTRWLEDDDEARRRRRQLNQAVEDRRQAGNTVLAARNDLEAAISYHDEAATRAAQQIHGTFGDGLPSVHDVRLAELAQASARWGTISKILGAAGLALIVVPGLGKLLLGASAMAKAAAAVKVGTTVVKQGSKATGVAQGIVGVERVARGDSAGAGDIVAAAVTGVGVGLPRAAAWAQGRGIAATTAGAARSARVPGQWAAGSSRIAVYGARAQGTLRNVGGHLTNAVDGAIVNYWRHISNVNISTEMLRSMPANWQWGTRAAGLADGGFFIWKTRKTEGDLIPDLSPLHRTHQPAAQGAFERQQQQQLDEFRMPR